MPVGSTITEVLAADEGPENGNVADLHAATRSARCGRRGRGCPGERPRFRPQRSSGRSQRVDRESRSQYTRRRGSSGTESDTRAPHRFSPRQRRLEAAGNVARTGPARVPPIRTRATRRSRLGAVRRSRVRRAVARAVAASWTEIPHFAVMREIDGDGLLDRLAARKRRATLAGSALPTSSFTRWPSRSEGTDPPTSGLLWRPHRASCSPSCPMRHTDARRDLRAAAGRRQPGPRLVARPRTMRSCLW